MNTSMASRARAVLAVLLMVLLAACVDRPGPTEEGLDTPPPTLPPTTEPPAPTTTQTLPPRPAEVQPLLIKHGWDLPRPDFVRNHAAAMDGLGYDGVVVALPSSPLVLSQEPLSYERLRSELQPLVEAPLTTLVHNFVIIYNGTIPSFRSEDWDVARTNVANLARAARDAGLEGIVYDNENYDNKLSWRVKGSEREVAGAEQDARARGREVLRAVASEWPDATFMTLHGPGLSEERSAEVYNQAVPYNDVSWANPLLGPFFMGMALAAAETGVTLVDGGEIYTLRSAGDFELAYWWMMKGLPEESPMVPDELRSSYAKVVDAAFGVYDRPWDGIDMNPAIWEATLVEALRRTDRYVWAYTELYDWWGVGWPRERVSQEWIDATVNARARIRAGATTD